MVLLLYHTSLVDQNKHNRSSRTDIDVCVIFLLRSQVAELARTFPHSMWAAIHYIPAWLPGCSDSKPHTTNRAPRTNYELIETTISWWPTVSSCTACELFSTLASLHALPLLFYCLLYTSPSPRDQRGSRMPSSA